MSKPYTWDELIAKADEHGINAGKLLFSAQERRLQAMGCCDDDGVVERDDVVESMIDSTSDRLYWYAIRYLRDIGVRFPDKEK